MIQDPDDAGDLGAVLHRVAVQFAAEGDGYAYFLGDEAIDTVVRHDWLAPLRQVLTAFPLTPANTSVNPGFEVIREVLNFDAFSSGQNSFLPIYPLSFCRYDGIVFAPVLGAALGWVRNRIVRRTDMGPVGAAASAAVYFHCCRRDVDPPLTVAGLFLLALASPAFWLAEAKSRKSPSTNSLPNTRAAELAATP